MERWQPERGSEIGKKNNSTLQRKRESVIEKETINVKTKKEKYNRKKKLIDITRRKGKWISKCIN